MITWRARYREHGLPGLAERPRSCAPATCTDADRRALIAAATANPPPRRVRWTPALLTEHLASQHDQQHRWWTPSRAWVGRAPRDAGLAVHKVRGWLHRKEDPFLNERIAAIEQAMIAARAGDRTVISWMERSPCRCAPLHVTTTGPGGMRRPEFEYRRRATLSRYATQEVATGEVGLLRASTRTDSDGFTMVLDDLVAAHGDDLTVIMDNGLAHTSRHARRWMAARLHVTVLFTLVHASWTNLVEVQLFVLARQVIFGGHRESAEAPDAVAQVRVVERNRRRRPMRFMWQRRGLRTSDSEH